MVCPDYDVCDKCYKRKRHEHELIPNELKIIPKASDSLQQVCELTFVYIQLLDNQVDSEQLFALTHCFSCEIGMCGVANCALIKACIRHYIACNNRICAICKKVESLISKHIEECKDKKCNVMHSLNRHRF